ncbi:ornithine cyclodeaminase family protein [Anaerotignum faecicola]|nr:ornithine cyclodeaminase family protein [Anaerotignum faecicola]
MKTLLLKKEDIEKIVSMKDAIDAVEEGYRAFCSGQVIQPEYIAMPFDAPRGELDFKAGYYSGNEIISLKASSGGYINNPSSYGLPAGMNTVLLWDARNCALLCIMEGSYITGYRTGAAGAVSVKYLARKNSEIVTSIGTGNQARNQIRAVSHIIKIKEIHAFDAFADSMEKFKKDIEGELGIPVILEKTSRAAAEKADILITTTRGKGPVIDASWVKPGTHIVAIGTDMRGKQEFDPEIFRGAKIINDSIEQCVKKGETWHPIDKGIIKKEDIYAEIGEIVIGSKQGRTNDEEITIFDSTGMAIQDNMQAYKLYKSALDKGIGTEFEFFK